MAGARTSGAAAGELGSLYSLGAAGGLTDGQLLERFLARDDPTAAEAAFTALVDRHGSMVLSVCRRELGDLHDAHDAFQATFLVLVSKAGSIRHRDSVGGWLFGIARRVAARARVEGARRRRHLEQFGAERAPLNDDPAATSIEPEPDYAPLLDEVDRLPERFRAPVVLHYFEGLTAEATAQRLGCARGTVLSRLSRARHRLRRRLQRRGVAPAVLIPAGDAVTRWLPPTPVPAWLAQGTIRAAASLCLAGATIESVVPTAVARLARRVARTLALSRVGAAAFLLIAVAGVSIGLAAAIRPGEDPQRGAAMEKPGGANGKGRTPRSAGEEKGEPVVIRGRVSDPDGKPVAGAGLLLSVPMPGLGGEPHRLGASGPDGQFEVTIPADRLDPPVDRHEIAITAAAIGAVAMGFGPDWATIDPRKSGEPIALKLRRDDVPIEGRVISLEGRPIAGLSVKTAYISEFPPALMNKLRENAGKMNPDLWGEMRNVFVPGEKGTIHPVRTGADGRFRVTGVGRDRVALLVIDGGSIEQTFAMVSTSGDRGYRPVLLPADGSGERKIEAPRFDLAAAPGRVIEGTVRDRDTGRPIAGARIQAWMAGVNHQSDAQGRFRIEGQPKGRNDVPNFFYVQMDDQPYIKYGKALDEPRGIGPVHLDITLKRGVWAEGKVTNRATRKPVKAVVVYFPFRDNPNVKDCPGATFFNNHIGDEPESPTDAEGRFRIPVLPGGGLLAVKVSEPGYLTARPLDGKTVGNVLFSPDIDFPYYQSPYHALVPIEAPAGKNLVLPGILLESGRMQHIRMVGPDGKPVTGTKVLCLQSGSLAGEDVPGDELTFIHANPGKAESIIAWKAGRSLGAVVDLKGDEPDPVRLVLQPTGAVTGRLVDEDGKPRAGVDLAVNQRFMSRGSSNGCERFGPETTGPDGRFRIKNLVPGLTYYVEVVKWGEINFSLRAEGYLHKTRWTLKPGEVQDWGDVQAKSYRP
jgi:RNA polymerase sigma factor (sigma-70 family)